MFSAEWDNQTEIELVKHGDLIRFEHVMTGRNIHTHQEQAPISKKMYQVTGRETFHIFKKYLHSVFVCKLGN